MFLRQQRLSWTFLIAIAGGCPVACSATTAFNLGGAANFGVLIGSDAGSTSNSLTVNNSSVGITGTVGIESGGYFSSTGGSISAGVDFGDAVSDSGYTNGTDISTGQSISGTNNSVSSSTITGGLVGGIGLSAAATQVSALQTLATNSISGGTSISSLTNCTGNVTLTAGATGTTVWNSAGVSLGTNCAVTISGTANSLVIINVTSGSFASTVNHPSSGIILSGGITADQILWNITGTGTNFTANGNTSRNVLQGIFLDTAGSYSLQNVTVDGWIYGANSDGGTRTGLSDTIGTGVTFAQGSYSLPEPATWLMSLIPIALVIIRQRKLPV